MSLKIAFPVIAGVTSCRLHTEEVCEWIYDARLATIIRWISHPFRLYCRRGSLALSSKRAAFASDSTGHICIRLTQVFSWHWCFRKNLYSVTREYSRFNKNDSALIFDSKVCIKKIWKSEVWIFKQEVFNKFYYILVFIFPTLQKLTIFFWHKFHRFKITDKYKRSPWA